MNLKIGNYASYLQIKELKEEMRPLRSEYISEGIVGDYDKDGDLIGIEFLAEIKPSYYGDYKEK